MNTSGERTQSIWMDTEVSPRAPMLDQDLTVDTVIVGSGIAGLSTAYELALEGRKVAVLDRGPIAGGITARTTAHLTSLCDESFKSLIDVQGLDAAEQFYESQAASIDRIEKIQNLESINCDFRRLDGFLFPALGTDPSNLDSNLEADRKVGIEVEDCKGLPFEGLKDTRCLRYSNQGTFHPLKYLGGVAAAIQKRGGKLFAQYEQNASSQIKLFDLEGKKITDLALPTMGTVFGSGGKWDSDELFYGFVNFTEPLRIFQVRVRRKQPQSQMLLFAFALPEL